MSAPLSIDLTGLTALVTGASSGLGAHFARVLAAQGADLVIAARRRDRLESKAEDLRSLGRSVQIAEMDVTDAASVETAMQRVQGQLDIVVNNSGVGTSGFLSQMTETDWSQVIDTNLTGVWRVTKAALPRMQNGGAIINIASITAVRPMLGAGAYSASKAAVEQLTRAMAIEFARDGLRVNALAPGYFATDLNAEYLASESGQKMRNRVPMRRFGDIHELDLPLLLLAAPQARYMTGSTLTVDGGHSIAPL